MTSAMRYILYDRNFTKSDPFFRIGAEGVSRADLMASFIENELAEVESIRFDNIVLTDLDTFFRRATSNQGKEVKQALDFQEHYEQDCLPF